MEDILSAFGCSTRSEFFLLDPELNKSILLNELNKILQKKQEIKEPPLCSVCHDTGSVLMVDGPGYWQSCANPACPKSSTYRGTD
jgi:hypothetical protein